MLTASSSAIVVPLRTQARASSWDPKWTPKARQALLKNGYEPTPLIGKRPVLDNWPNSRPTAEDIAAWERMHPTATNTGILTRFVPAVDDDVLDPTVADTVHQWVKELIPPNCPELLRYGRYPKRAILFRCDKSFPKVSTGKWVDEKGIEHQLEILCDGQQLVVYGTHPDTNEAYIWPSARPGRTPRRSLPLLTPEAAQTLVNRAKALFQERGWRPKREERKEPPKTNGLNRADGEAHKIATALADRIESLCRELLPNGHIDGRNWAVGDINGAPGQSLKISLVGENRGLWLDFADEGWKGDALDLVEAVKNLKTVDAMDWSRSWLGWPQREAPREKTKRSNGPAQSIAVEATPQAVTRTAVLVRADEMKPESINWAWKNRFAFGKLVVLAGDPGLGKSTILVELAALHSIGGEFPCGEGHAQECETLILTAEDGLRDTLIPRLMAAGADLKKIHFLTGTKAEGGDDEALFDLGRDIPALRKALKEHPNIRILIIDPLTAYLGPIKAKENSEVRRVLAPLVKLIEETGVLAVGNNHLNKSAGKALYRVLDSIAFVALGRIVHLVIKDADNPDNRKFICDKTNIGSKPLGLTYILQKTWITAPETGEEIETSRICWGTQHIDESADEALGDSTEPTHKDEAIDFLRKLLTDGPLPVTDIEAEAQAARLLGESQSISQSKPFRSARNALGIVTEKVGLQTGWVWSLPKVPS
jgi:putative DNA primase/helicase